MQDCGPHCVMGPPIGTDVLRGQPAPVASQSGELTCMPTHEGHLPAAAHSVLPFTS